MVLASSTSFAILPRSPWLDHQILACTLLVLPTCLFFLRPHFGQRRWRKRIWQPAYPGWVSGRASLTAHGQWLEGKRPPHLSKSCRTTLAGRAYSSAGQTTSAHYSMAFLQVFLAKVIRSMDESNLNPAALKKLHSSTVLALRATKMMAQSISRSMANLVVLKHHMWLNIM